MAPVPTKTATNRPSKSTRGASTSVTSTASRAKPKAKPAAQADSDWVERDQEEAAAQGWGVFTCIDMTTKKVFLEMQCEGPRFKADDQRAREFIGDRALGGDRLAIKAVRAVFRSKVGTKGRTK